MQAHILLVSNCYPTQIPYILSIRQYFLRKHISFLIQTVTLRRYPVANLHVNMSYASTYRTYFKLLPYADTLLLTFQSIFLTQAHIVLISNCYPTQIPYVLSIRQYFLHKHISYLFQTVTLRRYPVANLQVNISYTSTYRSYFKQLPYADTLLLPYNLIFLTQAHIVLISNCYPTQIPCC